MKIIFLCGSLEPGKDGVGDYTRRLAIEMVKQGHQVAAIALKDWHLTNEFDGYQNSEGTDLHVLRLPSIWPFDKMGARAKEWIAIFDPEWLSLQFVNFAFNFKGLHFGLGSRLAEMGKGRKWHIMFHELWVGMAMEAKAKHVIWGKVQRSLIKSMVLKLKPSAIHTQSHLYLAKLQKLGLKVGFLPLFSNIPDANAPTNNRKMLRENNEISFILFGTLHPMSPAGQFAREANGYAKKCGKRLFFKFIGRNGQELAHWVSALESENLAVEVVGELPPQGISKMLLEASVGISTSSIAYIEKSSTAAVMLEHGLPVICVANHSQLFDMQHIEPPYGILEYHNGNLENCLNMQFDLKEMNTISIVSNLLEKALEKNTV